MSNYQVNHSSLTLRRKIITTSAQLSANLINTRPDKFQETQIDLKPNLFASQRSAYHHHPNQPKPPLIIRTYSQKPLLRPVKQNIDYGGLLEVKIGVMRGTKAKANSPNTIRSIKHSQDKESYKQAIFRISPIKSVARQRISLSSRKSDISIETVGLVKGLDEKDFETFLLLLQRSEQKRSKQSAELFQFFNKQRLRKRYEVEQLGGHI